LVGAGVADLGVAVGPGPKVGVAAGPVAVGAGGLEKRPQPATRAAAAMSPDRVATNEGDLEMRLKRRLHGV
jgi:hypothetical protein